MEKVKEHKYMREWISLYNSGKSFRQIAKEYNVAMTTVKRRISNYVEKRPKSQNMQYAQEWLELLNSGTKKADIARMYNVSPSTVGSILSKVGVERNGNKKFMHLIDDMKEMYSLGKSLKEISDVLNVSVQLIADYLEFEGINRRPYAEACRNYDINDNFFEKIDSKEKAFLLGILWAIGNVIYDEGIPRNIRLVTTNKFLVEYIVSQLYNTDVKLTFREQDNTYRQDIQCIKLTEDLVKLGFSNKGNKKPPVLESDELMSSFADGMLYSKLTFPKEKVYIKSTDEPLIYMLANHIANEIDVDKESIKGVSFSRNTGTLGNLTIFRKSEVKKVKEYYEEVLNMYII